MLLVPCDRDVVATAGANSHIDCSFHYLCASDRPRRGVYGFQRQGCTDRQPVSCDGSQCVHGEPVMLSAAIPPFQCILWLMNYDVVTLGEAWPAW